MNLLKFLRWLRAQIDAWIEYLDPPNAVHTWEDGQ